MALYKKIVIIILILASHSVPYAINQKNNKVKIPSYELLLEAQFSCSNLPVSSYKFVRRIPSEPYTEVASKVWGIVKDSKLNYRSPKLKWGSTARSFIWSYKKMGLLRCGQPIQELSLDGIKIETLPVITEAFKKPGFFDLFNDEPNEEMENRNIIRYDLVRDGDNDGPAIPGRVGMPCLVKVEDVLADPKKIKLDILCKGESKEAMEFTKSEIDRALKVWGRK